MSKITKLAEHAKTLPTLMDIEDEIALIEALMKLSFREIKHNYELFCEMLDNLELSHADNGILELTKENEHVFLHFAQWLQAIFSKLGLDWSVDVSTFSLTLDDIEAQFPKYKKE